MEVSMTPGDILNGGRSHAARWAEAERQLIILGIDIKRCSCRDRTEDDRIRKEYEKIFDQQLARRRLIPRLSGRGRA